MPTVRVSTSRSQYVVSNLRPVKRPSRTNPCNVAWPPLARMSSTYTHIEARCILHLKRINLRYIRSQILFTNKSFFHQFKRIFDFFLPQNCMWSTQIYSILLLYTCQTRKKLSKMADEQWDFQITQTFAWSSSTESWTPHFAWLWGQWKLCRNTL